MTVFGSGIAEVTDPIAASQERTRVILAITVMVLLSGIVATILVYIFDNGQDNAAKLMITGIFTPIIGIVGTVLGFYFGSKDSS